MSSPVFSAHIFRPPIDLVPSQGGGLSVTFPAGTDQAPVCIDMADGDFTVSFPPGLVATIPSGADVTLNGAPFQLPGGGRGVIKLPNGGNISISPKQPALKVIVTGNGASMDPLPATGAT